MDAGDQSTTSEAKPRFTAALKHRDLRLLALAFIVDGGASWSYNVVLIAYVFTRTQSAGWVTALVTVRWVVGVLCGGYAGVLADRYDRRALLMVSAWIASVVTIGIAVIVWLQAPLWLLLVGAAVLTAVCTPVRPASGALIPEVVPERDLVAANALFALLESVIVVIGPGVGGLLLLAGEPVWGVLVNAASFVVAALIYSVLRVRSHGSAEAGEGSFRQWVSGVRTLGQHQKALVLTVFLILDSAAANSANVLLPALAEHLHGDEVGYTLLLAANALGGVVAAGLAQRLAASRRLAALIIGAIFLQCVPLWLSVFAGSVLAGSALQLISGIGMVIVDVLAFTTLQRDLPRDVLGRVLGTLDVLILASAVLASVLASTLYGVFGLAVAFGAIGLGFPLLGLLGLPVLRRLDADVAQRADRLAPITRTLDQLDLFAGAPRSLIEHLAESAQERTVPAGTTIIAQGDPSDALWVLEDGVLAVTAVRADGQAAEVPDVEAPGYVGELGLLERAVRSATVVTRTECRMLRIPGADFAAALEAAAPSPSMLGRAGARISRTAAAQ
ncbi:MULTISPECIES: MFS transporter [unclassified Microbacterium]|uniref:MFS transporter n=1 Tax=unclassified Microbacterium TaxID=2609290 RepID=UPI0012F77300|nr:MFS transporter [Microbacterium sp. MAH-37]MVQ40629.1 MFS transporter [Microbacterium sp. MAH-37]